MSAADARPFRLVIAMTGATGVIYGIRLLEVLQDSPVETHLIMSTWASRTMVAETSHDPAAVRTLSNHVYDPGDLAALPALDSFLTDGMIVAPCSMKTLASIAHRMSESVISRAADVTLKEGRKLVLLVRESPLSVIHLENMLTVAKAGAVVAPPVPAFYSRPQTVEDVVDHTVGRLLDQFGLPHQLISRWGERRRVRNTTTTPTLPGDVPLS